MKLITAFEAAELRDRDNYPSEDINDLELDQISQMIEQAAEYTNFIVLTGKPNAKKYEALKKASYNVVSLPGGKTDIQWPEI
jgi:hypothetical protein